MELNATVLERLELNEIHPAAYAHHHFGRGASWHGDKCGCPDDRCIGHHHDDVDDCDCFEALLQQFMADVPVRQWNDPGLPTDSSKVVDEASAVGGHR